MNDIIRNAIREAISGNVKEAVVAAVKTVADDYLSREVDLDEKAADWVRANRRDTVESTVDESLDEALDSAWDSVDLGDAVRDSCDDSDIEKALCDAVTTQISSGRITVDLDGAAERFVRDNKGRVTALVNSEVEAVIAKTWEEMML